jgi:hypothetical protein
MARDAVERARRGRVARVIAAKHTYNNKVSRLLTAGSRPA